MAAVMSRVGSNWGPGTSATDDVRGSAPRDPLHPVQQGKDPMYLNRDNTPPFPHGIKGTDEKGRSFGGYKDHPPGFYKSG